jgi:hypothetical protein
MAADTTAGFNINANYVPMSLGNPNRFSDFLKPAAPKALLYNDLLMGPAGTAQWTETLADNGTSFTPSNQKFNISLSSNLLYNNRDAILCFGATCTSTVAADLPFFQKGIWNWINRIRVLAGSIVLMDQLDKNTFTSTQYRFARSANFDASVGQALCGIDSIAQRTAWGLNGQTYGIYLNIPLLTSEFIDMRRFQGPLTIEFYLAAASVALSTGSGLAPAGTLNYTITNPRIRTMEMNYQDDIRQMVNGISRIYYPYTNYKLFSTVIPTGTSNFQYQIPVKVQGVRSIIGFLRYSSDLNNPASTDYLTSSFQNAGVVQYQLKIDNNYFPPQAMATGGQPGAQQAYVEAVRVMDRFETGFFGPQDMEGNGTFSALNFNSVPFSGNDYAGNGFIMPLNLKVMDDNNPNYVTNFDVSPGTVNLVWTMQFSPTPTVPLNLYLIVMHTTIVVSDSNGRSTMNE